MGEPQFATYGEVLDFPAAGQTPHGAHIDGQKGGNLFWCHKRAVQCPVDACHLRHGGVYGLNFETQKITLSGACPVNSSIYHLKQNQPMANSTSV